MNKINFGIIAAFIVALASCTTTQQGAAVGGLGGAAIGGIVGHQSGHGVAGAAIGGAAGALGGAVVGNKMEQKKFCPVCGTVYTADKQYCPKDGTELKFQQ
jgi:uncharacterized protein YcfJ